MLDHDIDTLLASAAVSNGKVQLDAAVAAQVTKRLRDRYDDDQDPKAYLDLLAVWSRFMSQGFEPAASQLHAIVLTLPESAQTLKEQRAQAEAAVNAGKQRAPSGLENQGAKGNRGPGDDVEY